MGTVGGQRSLGTSNVVIWMRPNFLGMRREFSCVEVSHAGLDGLKAKDLAPFMVWHCPSLGYIQ